MKLECTWPTTIEHTKMTTDIFFILPLYQWVAVCLSGQTLVGGHHTFSGLLSHQVCSQSSPAKPGHQNTLKKKRFCLVKVRSGHRNNLDFFFHSQLSKYFFKPNIPDLFSKEKIYSYFDFGFIWSFIGVWHFGPLFLSLSVRLHNATKKGTFILKDKKKKQNKKWATIKNISISLSQVRFFVLLKLNRLLYKTKKLLCG